MEPLVILFPFVWASPRMQGYIAFPPLFGPPRWWRMRHICVCCVVKRVPPSQLVLSVKSTIVLNVLTPTLVEKMMFVNYNRNESDRE